MHSEITLDYLTKKLRRIESMLIGIENKLPVIGNLLFRIDNSMFQTKKKWYVYERALTAGGVICKNQCRDYVEHKEAERILTEKEKYHLIVNTADKSLYGRIVNKPPIPISNELLDTLIKIFLNPTYSFSLSEMSKHFYNAFIEPNALKQRMLKIKENEKRHLHQGYHFFNNRDNNINYQANSYLSYIILFPPYRISEFLTLS